MKSLLFLVYADRCYEMFVVPYIYFALRNNPNASVEVILDERDDFIARNRYALEKLDEVFFGKYALSQAPRLEGVIPNTIRFMVNPQLSAHYLYIGDIDLLVFEDVVEVHERLMEDFGLPFSNIVRPYSEGERKRLSGLHFCKFDHYYPLPDVSDLNLSTMNDEAVLYKIMSRKGLMVDESFRMRPECGIHMSLNRDPMGRSSIVGNKKVSRDGAVGWGGGAYYSSFLEQIFEPDFLNIQPFLDLKFRFLLNILESIARDEFRSLQLLSLNCFLDRRFLLEGNQVLLRDVLELRSFYIKNKMYAEAEELGYKAVLLWPKNVDLWIKHAWLMLAKSEDEKAVECFKMVVSIEGGAERLSNSKVFINNAKKIRALVKDEEKLIRMVEECGE